MDLIQAEDGHDSGFSSEYYCESSTSVSSTMSFYNDDKNTDLNTTSHSVSSAFVVDLIRDNNMKTLDVVVDNAKKQRATASTPRVVRQTPRDDQEKKNTSRWESIVRTDSLNAKAERMPLPRITHANKKPNRPPVHRTIVEEQKALLRSLSDQHRANNTATNSQQANEELSASNSSDASVDIIPGDPESSLPRNSKLFYSMKRYNPGYPSSTIAATVPHALRQRFLERVPAAQAKVIDCGAASRSYPTPRDRFRPEAVADPVGVLALPIRKESVEQQPVEEEFDLSNKIKIIEEEEFDLSEPLTEAIPTRKESFRQSILEEEFDFSKPLTPYISRRTESIETVQQHNLSKHLIPPMPIRQESIGTIQEEEFDLSKSFVVLAIPTREESSEQEEFDFSKPMTPYVARRIESMETVQQHNLSKHSIPPMPMRQESIQTIQEEDFDLSKPFTPDTPTRKDSTEQQPVPEDFGFSEPLVPYIPTRNESRKQPTLQLEYDLSEPLISYVPRKHDASEEQVPINPPFRSKPGPTKSLLPTPRRKAPTGNYDDGKDSTAATFREHHFGMASVSSSLSVVATSIDQRRRRQRAPLVRHHPSETSSIRAIAAGHPGWEDEEEDTEEEGASTNEEEDDDFESDRTRGAFPKTSSSSLSSTSPLESATRILQLANDNSNTSVPQGLWLPASPSSVGSSVLSFAQDLPPPLPLAQQHQRHVEGSPSSHDHRVLSLLNRISLPGPLDHQSLPGDRLAQRSMSVPLSSKRKETNPSLLGLSQHSAFRVPLERSDSFDSNKEVFFNPDVPAATETLEAEEDRNKTEEEDDE